ncbi:hypothetical protein ACFQ1M_14945 [Sungkyunkwania multivorans]|uniref:Beta-lactamase-inhibitor-like PepSY-like domain-containing protein n=1 Tax=Sungkyunkwania multivorans TaxID=1173618 RepID=A0ABW3D0E8_9FLAO
MKKVFFVIAAAFSFVLLSTTNTMAQDTAETTMEKVEAVQDEFKQISPEELPQAISEALQRDFKATPELTEVYKNSKDEYKLVLTVDGQQTTLYANEKGEWIQKDE